MRLKMPYGISKYEKIVNDGYYYVDKTKYIEKLENLPETSIMFLRPRKFGKTLFTSVLENYYDKNKADKFENLYGNTYIGKNPTELRNSYCILRFNFSGIDTSSEEETIRCFKNSTIESIKLFVGKYNIDFYINENQDAEEILNSLFTAFSLQKNNEKIYVIVDEYDHFANELLGFYPERFRILVSKNGKVRKWYEILKKGTETVVDRIFITGVAPITLDSLTSGFNIGKDITQDEEYNDMMGFTKEELVGILNNQEISIEEQEKILPIMKENYDGYKFSLNAKNQIYNSNMCLYFLSDYIRLGRIPERLIDMNIASDYSKIGKMLDLCKGENRLEVLRKTVQGEPIVDIIIEKFNPAIEFTETLTIPNKVMKEIYASYFMRLVNQEADFKVDGSTSQQILREIALEGKIDKIIEGLRKYTIVVAGNEIYVQEI